MPVCLDYSFFISILFTIYGLVYYLISKCWLRPSALFNRNRISGVIVSVLDSSSVDRVKLKTMKKVFVASPLITQQNVLVIYIYKTQIDVQSLIDVQSSNRRPILKSMAVSYFLKSTSKDVTDVGFK